MAYNRLTRYDKDGRIQIRQFNGTIGGTFENPFMGSSVTRKAIEYLAELEDKIESGELGNIKDYQAEIDRLSTELAHREEDLIHADENVFYRECNAKLHEDEIKKQAVKEFMENLNTYIRKELLRWRNESEERYYGQQDILKLINQFQKEQSL